MTKVLILGSTGLLGQAMTSLLREREYVVIGAARKNAEVELDITDETALLKTLSDINPDIVVNSAALVGVDICEKNPLLSWQINARPLSFIASWSRENERPFLHISTDQYFVDGDNEPHDEQTSVTILNEYARTKFVGEMFSLTAPQALVLRTSIVGLRNWEQPTFAEWVIDVVENDKPVTLFSDAYTSSIDVATFARASIDLLNNGGRGLYNLAAREVYSKEDFVREMAAQLGRPLSHASVGSVASLETMRAHCLGLEVGRATHLLTYELPTLREVVSAILTERSNGIVT